MLSKLRKAVAQAAGFGGNGADGDVAFECRLISLSQDVKTIMLCLLDLSEACV